MIIGLGWSLEKNNECEKMFNFLVYHMWFQQGCVRFVLSENKKKFFNLGKMFQPFVIHPHDLAYLGDSDFFPLRYKFLDGIFDVAEQLVFPSLSGLVLRTYHHRSHLRISS